MFRRTHEKNVEKYIVGATAYIESKYEEPAPKPVLKESSETSFNAGSGNHIRYSLADTYDESNIDFTMRNMLRSGDFSRFNSMLENSINQTFVEKVNALIRQKNLRESTVYKAAQIDRRLFSKVMSDTYYKPSKDTALAIAYALELTIDQANDLLKRAGYSFSHSNKRDIVMEYFFREQVYKLDEINMVLDSLGLKTIGR